MRNPRRGAVGAGALLLFTLLALALAPAARAAVPGSADRSPPEIVRLDDGSTRYDLHEHGDYLYRMPSRWDWIAKPIPDVGTWFKETFRRENTWPILGVTALTLVLMRYDQELIDAVQRGGDKIGIPPNVDNTRTVLSIGKAQLRLPSDVGSVIYFFGDGWTHLSAGAAFLGWGLSHDDPRAVQTGSQVFEAVLSAGGLTQVIKHLTGHEDPVRATKPGGRWRLLPNQRDYFKNVSSYDAFPSGHLATAMATVTVIAENYPEVGYVRPVGYTMMTMLALQMMNNGVHWASDYPVALAIGYGLGHIAVRQGRKETPAPDPNAPHDPNAPGAPAQAETSLLSRLSPTVMADDAGELMPGVRYGFAR
jgi:hypothetical protein